MLIELTKKVLIDGKEFIMTENENEIILTTIIGKFQVENVFKKDNTNDGTIHSRLSQTLKNALYEVITSEKTNE